MSDEMSERRWVYIGPARGKSEDLAEFHELTDDPLVIVSKYFSLSKTKKACKSLSPGLMYTVMASEGSADLSSLKHTGLWPNVEDRVRWRTSARAFEIQKNAEKRAARDASDNAILEILEPLRKEYSKTNYLGKLAIEVLVLKALKTPI